MGTVLECQVERNFKNLEKCNEIQGEITTKTVYPIRYPCYVDEITLKTKNNFETEEKMIHFDSNNILDNCRNTKDKSKLDDKNKIIDKSKIKLSEIKFNSKDENNNNENIIDTENKDIEEIINNYLLEKEQNKNENENKINNKKENIINKLEKLKECKEKKKIINKEYKEGKNNILIEKNFLNNGKYNQIIDNKNELNNNNNINEKFFLYY